MNVPQPAETYSQLEETIPEFSEEESSVALIKLFETDEYTDAQRALAKLALSGVPVCVDEVRQREWEIIRLSKPEYDSLWSGFPTLRTRMVETLREKGITSSWKPVGRTRTKDYWQLTFGVSEDADTMEEPKVEPHDFIVGLLERSLVKDWWPQPVRARMVKIAKMRFIEQLTDDQIAKRLMLPKRAVQQIFREGILETLQNNLSPREYDLLLSHNVIQST